MAKYATPWQSEPCPNPGLVKKNCLPCLVKPYTWCYECKIKSCIDCTKNHQPKGGWDFIETARQNDYSYENLLVPSFKT